MNHSSSHLPIRECKYNLQDTDKILGFTTCKTNKMNEALFLGGLNMNALTVFEFS